MTEEWRPIPGWEATYEVSDQGNVRSIDRIITSPNRSTVKRKGMPLRTFAAHHGYRKTTLKGGGVTRQVFVHRLVLEAFVGPPKDGSETRHLDGDPSNNRLGNLAWGTRAENTQDRLAHGRTTYARNRGSCPHGHLHTEENTRIDKTGTPICRICNRDRLRRYRRELKEQA